jgi:hypothetical protein
MWLSVLGCYVSGAIIGERWGVRQVSYPFEHDNETEWKRLHDRVLAACRAALGDAAFGAAWAAGQALTLEQAVAEALGEGE